ncbi:MAG: SH3 domain-containing protein [Bacteroidales bacterium]|nr:SH3 domain-containing protein [Bacteroidales bacterium]
MKKIFLILVILILSAFFYGQSLEENETESDFTSHYEINDSNINIRSEPKLSSSKVGKIDFYGEILVNPSLSTVKEKIGKYEGYWLRCYVPKLKVYGYVFSQYFEFKYAARRDSKLKQLVTGKEKIDQSQFKDSKIFKNDSTKVIVNLPNVKTEYVNNIVDSPSYHETEIAYINEKDNIYALRYYWYEGRYYIFYLGTENTVYKTRYTTIVYNKNRTKMALYNLGDDTWGSSEVVVFDAKSGKQLKKIDLSWEDRVIDLKWDNEKLIIDYDKLIEYPGEFKPTIVEVDF